MEGFNQERRGLFDGLQVPNSLNAVVLAAVGIFVYWLGILAIEEAFEVPGESHCRLLAGMLGNITSRTGYPGYVLARLGGWENVPTAYPIGVWFLFLAWSTVVWAFFAAGIQRIAAMKIAREEGLELKAAVGFAARKFLPNVLSAVFVWLIIGFFYLLCNATIAGWLGRIPYVGDVLLGLLFFLVLASSFLVVFAAALGILGFNLASAAIATEASDTFDGVSRAWNYLLARPWTVLLTYVATFLVIGLVLFFGGYFLRVSVRSLTVGKWGLGAAPRTVEVDEDLRGKLDLPPGQSTVLLPGKGDYLYGRVIGDRYDPRDGKIYFPQAAPESGGRPPVIDVAPAIEPTLDFAVMALHFWVNLARLFMWAFVAAYFLSAQTMVYFFLRRDVEGDEYTEITLDDEAEEDEPYVYDQPPAGDRPAAGEGAAPGKQLPLAEPKPPIEP